MVTIREANENDFATLVELFKEYAGFERRSEKMQNSLQRMQLEKEFFRGFVAETEQAEIVGYTTHFFMYTSWTGRSLHIDDLYVRQAYRSKGIGTKFMEKTIALAKDSGCHKLKWQVSKWNQPAINFYKKIGAEISSNEQNCELEW